MQHETEKTYNCVKLCLDLIWAHVVRVINSSVTIIHHPSLCAWCLVGGGLR